MNKYKLGILGCGAILSRHLEAVKFNSDCFEIVGVFDPKINLKNVNLGGVNYKQYTSEQQLYQDSDVNCVVILTPSGLHTSQIRQAINYKKNVIVEKPAGFDCKELNQLQGLANSNGVKIFTVLQVRLNPTIQALHKFITQGYLGNIRGVSLIQRWQRPLSYFDNWRGDYNLSGGVLREFSIHYIDAMLYVLGNNPKLHSSIFKNVKLNNAEISDSVNILLDFDNFSGNIEVNIGAEPTNLECSLSIMSDKGFIKLGGKSLDVVIDNKFINEQDSQYFSDLCQIEANRLNVKLASIGASPYHPELYYNIIHNPTKFELATTIPVIELIENIYKNKS
jgi:UDP-N-acetyl-2-amino-2-deoxyglucuronate dehydrogenase